MSIFYESDNNFFPIPSSKITKLKPSIYDIKFSPMTGIYLEKTANKFDLPDKIYGETVRRRIEKIKKLFLENNSSYSVLLLGEKGTGKSLTVKKVSNDLIEQGYKIILFNNRDFPFPPFKSLLNILDKAIIIFDEFEKITYVEEHNESDIGDKVSQVKLLTLLDGAESTFKNIHFIFTANSKGNIRSEFFLRPSRVRYIMNYKFADISALKEIIDDKLKRDDINKDEIIQALSKFENINYDLIIKFIEEINRGYSIEETIEDFGLEIKMFKLYKIKIDNEEFLLNEPIYLQSVNSGFSIEKSKLEKALSDKRALKVLKDFRGNNITLYKSDVNKFDISTGDLVYSLYIHDYDLEFYLKLAN